MHLPPAVFRIFPLRARLQIVDSFYLKKKKKVSLYYTISYFNPVNYISAIVKCNVVIVFITFKSNFQVALCWGWESKAFEVFSFIINFLWFWHIHLQKYPNRKSWSVCCYDRIDFGRVWESVYVCIQILIKYTFLSDFRVEVYVTRDRIILLMGGIYEV